MRIIRLRWLLWWRTALATTSFRNYWTSPRASNVLNWSPKSNLNCWHWKGTRTGNTSHQVISYSQQGLTFSWASARSLRSSSSDSNDSHAPRHGYQLQAPRIIEHDPHEAGIARRPRDTHRSSISHQSPLRFFVIFNCISSPTTDDINFHHSYLYFYTNLLLYISPSLIQHVCMRKSGLEISHLS